MLDKTSKIINFKIPPYPEYIVSSYRSFLQSEKHITRISDEFVIIFMLDRELYFAEGGRDVAVEKGQWYIQVPGLLQEGKKGSPAPYYYYIHFYADSYFLLNDEVEYSGNILEKIEKAQDVFLPITGIFDISKFKPLFDKLSHSSKLPKNNIIFKQAAFLEILGKLIEEVYSKDDKENKLEIQVLDYLANNYNTIESCEELEARFHFSIDYLMRRLKKQCGVTPWKYVQQLRIEKAKELLINSDYTLTFIANEVGYKDVSVFYKAFQRYTRTSPGNWRSKHRGTI